MCAGGVRRLLVPAMRPDCMSDPLRENGPILLVPSAWGVVAAAQTGAVSERTLFIALTVMATILLIFAVVSRNEMDEGVLRAWFSVLVVGFFLTTAGAVGLAGLVASADILLAVSIYGWMFTPAAGLAYTARESESPASYANAAGAVLSVVGAAIYTVSLVGFEAPFPSPTLAVAAVSVVGVGQTVGIADAVYRY